MIQSIIKRDGRVVLYDQNKIAAAILRALEAAHEGNAADAAIVANDVQRELETRFKNSNFQIRIQLYQLKCRKYTTRACSNN